MCKKQGGKSGPSNWQRGRACGNWICRRAMPASNFNFSLHCVGSLTAPHWPETTRRQLLGRRLGTGLFVSSFGSSSKAKAKVWRLFIVIELVFLRRSLRIVAPVGLLLDALFSLLLVALTFTCGRQQPRCARGEPLFLPLFIARTM